jgi:hypothetical protein
MKRFFLEKPKVFQLVNEFLAFYVTQMPSSVFIRAWLPIPSQINTANAHTSYSPYYLF